MGKFKEENIKMINSDFPITKMDLTVFAKEEISNEFNNRITVEQYIIDSKNFIYEIIPINTKVHLWDWSDCRREIGAKLLYSELDGNLIKRQVFESKERIDTLKLDEFNLKVKYRIK